MSDFDPTPWLAAGGFGTGTGFLGWLAARRKNKADAALTEVQSVAAALDVWKATVQRMDGELSELRTEVRELRSEARQHARSADVLIEYVNEAWRHYEVDSSRVYPYALPGNRPPHILAIVRPEVADAITAPVQLPKIDPIQVEES